MCKFFCDFFAFFHYNGRFGIRSGVFTFRSLIYLNSKKAYTQKQTIILDKNEQKLFYSTNIFKYCSNIFLLLPKTKLLPDCIYFHAPVVIWYYFDLLASSAGEVE